MSVMDEAAGPYPGMLVTLDAALEREFERLVRENANLAVRVAFSVLHQREDAEDVAQEAFARAHRRFAGLRSPDQFRAWIVRTTWRLAIDRWRTERRRQRREEAAVTRPVASVEEVAEATERATRLWEAVDALPEKLRITIILSALEGHDVADVARLLEIPQGTVKSRLFLARKTLAERLRCLANGSTSR